MKRRNFLKQTGCAALGFSFLPTSGLLGEEKKLILYNWDTYVGETTLDDFNAASGVEVKMDLFADNSELFAKLRGGNPGYDVIVPSNDWIQRLAQGGLLETLDLKKIPNLKNVSDEWKNLSFDPGNRYSVPYFWGTMGIGFRKSVAGETKMDSMKYMLDSDRFSGRIAWLSESSTMIDTALKYLGHDPGKPSKENIAEAEALLKKQKKHVKVIAEDNGQDLLLSGEVDFCLEWSGDISQVMLEDEDLAYAIVPDGSYRWCDNLCIAAGAPHPENAHRFIDYVLRPDVSAKIAEYIGYSTPNQAALALTSDAYRNDEARFPPKDEIDKLFFPIYNGEKIESQMDEAWTRILAG